MNTIRLHVPWWVRITWRTAPTPASQEPMHGELAHLDARTLRDIGAPEALLARAHARCAAPSREREGIRLDVAAGAWRHW